MPLFTVDSFFSIWSESDRLYDQVTKHWTGRRNPVTAGVFIDGKLFGEDKYIEVAADMAEKWQKDASNNKATRLSFDNENSWSLKYNIVWDKLLNINIFNPSIFEKEDCLNLLREE